MSLFGLVGGRSGLMRLERGGGGMKCGGVFSSVSDSLGGGGPCSWPVSKRLIAIMDDPWWQRQVKPSHM